MNIYELKRFEKILTDRKMQIIKNMQDAHSEIQNFDEVGVGDEADIASLNTDRMIEQAINSQQNKELQDIEYALGKMKNGEYGICEMCDEDISIPRLEVKPHARYCIVCREMVEKAEKHKKV